MATSMQAGGHEGKGSSLGPLLCWAVVFADIGTSIYYTPGILYQTVGSLAGFFVILTMFVFILLTLKYVEVTHRFPQGGGVVSVAAQAINPWFGALGGMFILVDYFLTAAISCLSGIIYFSVVFPGISPMVLWITIGVLVLLGLLNWFGITESARVSLVGALIAFFSDIAILITVFTHVSLGDLLALFPKMFAGQSLNFGHLLAGFAGAFLAFSGLESISQLSPVMKHPHKRVAGIAMLLVVITIGITSPLLTVFSTMLLPQVANDPHQRDFIISSLAGATGGPFLKIEVAISATALLVFASNTAIIGAYHVFMALSRMGFLPSVVLQRNKLRGTPHYAIILATGIPIVVLIAVSGKIEVLGDLYAFGLLGAFSLTCLGLDIVRARDWRKVRARQQEKALRLSESNEARTDGHNGATASDITSADDLQISRAPSPAETPSHSPSGALSNGMPTVEASEKEVKGVWFKVEFFLGILTTILVMIAWGTNLFTKRDATFFGGGVTLLGMGIAYVTFLYNSRKSGIVPVPVVLHRIEERMPNAVLAVLTAGNKYNDAVIRAAIHNAETPGETKPVMFLYVGEKKPRKTEPRMMEIVDPYLEDQSARETFGKAEGLSLKAKLPSRTYVYLQEQPSVVNKVWQRVHPRDTVLPAQDAQQFKDINPDRIRYELTPDGKVAHLLKRW